MEHVNFLSDGAELARAVAAGSEKAGGGGCPCVATDVLARLFVFVRRSIIVHFTGVTIEF